MAVIDTKEIHKVVDDTDRFDTSQAGNSVTLQYLDSGEVNVIAEFNGISQEQIINSQKPFLLTYLPSNSNFNTRQSLTDMEDGELLVCLVK